MDKKVADAINEFATQITDDGTINTYKEILNYISTHGSEANDMMAAIDALEALVGDTVVATQIANAIAAENLAQYAKTADIEGTLQKVDTQGTVTEAINAAINALAIGDYAKAADLTAAITQHNTDKDALEAEIAKKANDADLATIAKTGSTDDLVQGAMTLVFDCGGAV